MNHGFRTALCFWFSISALAQPNEQALSREEWGAPPVNVSHSGGKWRIIGRKQSVSLDETNLTIEIQAGQAKWSMVASITNDMIVKSNDLAFAVRLADALDVAITRYDTGYKTGIKLKLSGWQEPHISTGANWI